MNNIRRRLIGALAFVGCLVALSPFFWAIYRIMAFHTIPRDDYAPYLLWLLGQRGGAFPGSPYAYRVLAVLAAVPFDWMLPPLHLSDLPASVSLPYLRATAAIAALSYVSALGSAFAASRLARRRGLTAEQAVLAGTLLFALCWHSQIYGLDPLAIFLVALLLSLLHRPVMFAALILVSIVVDEKVCMVFALWLSLRCLLLHERQLRLPWIASLAALAAYLFMVVLVRVPGNTYQLQPMNYLATIVMNLRASVSGRGLVLNVLPTAVLAAIAVAGWPAAGRGEEMARRADILLIPALVLLALTVTQYFQIGRVVMHAAPIFVIPAAASISAWHRRIVHFVTAERR